MTTTTLQQSWHGLRYLLSFYDRYQRVSPPPLNNNATAVECSGWLESTANGFMVGFVARHEYLCFLSL